MFHDKCDQTFYDMDRRIKRLEAIIVAAGLGWSRTYEKGYGEAVSPKPNYPVILRERIDGIVKILNLKETIVPAKAEFIKIEKAEEK